LAQSAKPPLSGWKERKSEKRNSRNTEKAALALRRILPESRQRELACQDCDKNHKNFKPLREAAKGAKE